MINEVCTEASQSLDPQCCTHNLETRLHWVMCSNKISDICLFAYDTDILHTPHRIAILIPISPYHNFLQLAFDFTCIVPAVVLLWLLSCILRNTSSSSPLTNLQKLLLLGASGSWCAIKSLCQMIIWLRSLKNQVHISSSTWHTKHQMITSSHTRSKLMFYSCIENRCLIVRFSTKVRMRAIVHVHFPAMGRCPHILLCAQSSDRTC